MRFVLNKTQAERIDRIIADLDFIGDQMAMGPAAKDAVTRNAKELREIRTAAVVLREGRAD